jgi:hypothetical protein
VHEPIAGRALVPGHVPHEVQIALPPRAMFAAEDGAGGPPRIAPLPASVSYETVAAGDDGRGEAMMLIGLQDGTRPLFRLPRSEHLVVLGPRGAGRSNALAIVVTDATRAKHGDTWVINPRRAPALRRAATAAEVRYAERPPDVNDLFDELVCTWDARVAAYNAGEDAPAPWTIVIDDIDAVDLAPHVNDALHQIGLRGPDVLVRICVSADTQALRSTYPSGAMRTLLNLRAGILLAPATVEDFDLFGTRGRPARMSPGRGYACAGGAKHAVQVARYPVD